MVRVGDFLRGLVVAAMLVGTAAAQSLGQLPEARVLDAIRRLVAVEQRCGPTLLSAPERELLAFVANYLAPQVPAEAMDAWLARSSEPPIAEIECRVAAGLAATTMTNMRTLRAAMRRDGVPNVPPDETSPADLRRSADQSDYAGRRNFLINIGVIVRQNERCKLLGVVEVGDLDFVRRSEADIHASHPWSELLGNREGTYNMAWLGGLALPSQPTCEETAQQLVAVNPLIAEKAAIIRMRNFLRWMEAYDERRAIAVHAERCNLFKDDGRQAFNAVIQSYRDTALFYATTPQQRAMIVTVDEKGYRQIPCEDATRIVGNYIRTFGWAQIHHRIGNFVDLNIAALVEERCGANGVGELAHRRADAARARRNIERYLDNDALRERMAQATDFSVRVAQDGDCTPAREASIKRTLQTSPAD